MFKPQQTTCTKPQQVEGLLVSVSPLDMQSVSGVLFTAWKQCEKDAQIVKITSSTSTCMQMEQFRVRGH